MKRRNMLKTITAAFLFLGVAAGNTQAQQPSAADAVKAANEAFYAALSARDMSAMQKVWSTDREIFNIGPRAKIASVGADAVKVFQATFDLYSQFKVTFEQAQLRINGPIAWVTGIERSQRTFKNGESSTATNLGTNIFANQGGRWLMVGHHASVMPN